MPQKLPGIPVSRRLRQRRNYTGQPDRFTPGKDAAKKIPGGWVWMYRGFGLAGGLSLRAAYLYRTRLAHPRISTWARHTQTDVWIFCTERKPDCDQSIQIKASGVLILGETETEISRSLQRRRWTNYTIFSFNHKPGVRRFLAASFSKKKKNFLTNQRRYGILWLVRANLSCFLPRLSPPRQVASLTGAAPFLPNVSSG